MATYKGLVFELVDDNDDPVMNPITGQPVYRLSPEDYVYLGYPPTEAVMFGQGWRYYEGSIAALSQDCGVVTTPPVDTSAPTWKLDYKPADAVRGYEYSESIYYSLPGIAADEHTIVRVDYVSGPAWLSSSVSPSEGKLNLRGTYPAGTTSFVVYLDLVQDDGKRTTKRFTIGVGTALPYAYFVYQSNNTLAVYVGPNGTGNPTTRMVAAPAGYAYIDTYPMANLPQVGLLGTKSYYFAYVYPNIIQGTYTDVINWLDQQFSFTLNLTPGQYGEGPVTLSPADQTPGDLADEGDYELDPAATPVNNPPIVTNPQPDVLISGQGVFSIQLPADQFSDPGDTFTLTAWKYDGGRDQQDPLPPGLSFDPATRTINGISDFADQQFIIRIIATDSVGQRAIDPFLFTAHRSVTNQPPTTLVIDKMAVFLPLGWRDTSFGQLHENVVLLVNVANGSKSTPVQAQYAQSRNDASFGNMQPLDYSQNSAENPLPAGYTHFTQFNDEVFTGNVRTFRARLTNVSGSQVSASYQGNASYPDHTTTLIYPTTN